MSVPFVGVMTRELSPELRAQTNLPEGFGLLVMEVMPESPAAAAGIKIHDILSKMDDQHLINMEQLMTLVRSHHKGDRVTFSVLSGGQEKSVAVELGEHEAEPPPPVGVPGTGRAWAVPFTGDQPGHGMPDKQWRERTEHFQKQMHEFRERMEDWTRNGRRGPAPEAPRFGPKAPHHDAGKADDPDKGGGKSGPQAEAQSTTSHSSSATVLRRDETGEYLLRQQDDQMVFTVRPKDGKEQSWKFKGAEGRDAIPEIYRRQLKELEEIHRDLPAPKL